MQLAIRMMVAIFGIVLLMPQVAFGQLLHETRSVRQGGVVEIDVAPCIHEPPGRNVGTTLVNDGTSMRMLFKPYPQQTGTVVLYLELGDALADDKMQCNAAVAKKYLVTIDDPQQVSDEATSTVFQVLVAALVLAVLLESAFELLFNWRLFQEYFVGKSWRTPIMFAVSLLVITRFDLDVVGPIVDAYRGQPAGTVDGGLLTAILSAMIVAGGSVGVNRLMKKLGIRSPFPKVDDERAQVSETEAYISVSVVNPGGEKAFAVNLSEMAPDPDVPALLGVAGAARPFRARRLLFPARQRVPRSGGLKIPADKTYRFSVTDLETGALYDIAGKPVETHADASAIRFAPRAFIDLVVTLKSAR